MAHRGDLIETLQRFGRGELAGPILEIEIHIATDVPRVIHDLPRKLRVQLAALNVDIIGDLEKSVDRKAAKDWSHQLGSEGPRRERMLARKLATAREALTNLRQYASADVDKRLGLALGFPFRSAADDCLKRLSELKTDRSFDDLLPLNKTLQEAAEEDPMQFAMVKLYWFFRSGCRQSANESEVRVALVRNGLWHPYFKGEVSLVAVDPEYQKGQSKGCQAVHEAVRRFSQGTAR